jgi:hypothetical protein
VSADALFTAPDDERGREGNQRDGQRRPADHRVALPVGVADEGEQDGAGERQRPRKGQEHCLPYLQR